MALHSKKEFAKMCGLTTGNLTVYISRKKVIASGDYINDSIEINKLFLESRKLLIEKKGDTPKEERPERKLRLLRPDPGLPEPPKIEDPDDEFDDDEDEGSDSGLQNTMTGLTKKKMQVEIEKKKREIALLKLREEKLNALVIPTELVKTVISQHTKSISTSFKNSLENVLTLISKQSNLSVTQIADIRGRLLHELNTAVDKSVNESKKNVANIVREFVESKSIGERN